MFAPKDAVKNEKNTGQNKSQKLTAKKHVRESKKQNLNSEEDEVTAKKGVENQDQDDDKIDISRRKSSGNHKNDDETPSESDNKAEKVSDTDVE